jgi:hypothetical protein
MIDYFYDAAAAKIIEKKHLMFNRMLNQMANLVAKFTFFDKRDLADPI